MTLSNTDAAYALHNSPRLRAMPPHRFVGWALSRMGAVDRSNFEATWRCGGFTQSGYLARMGYATAHQQAAE